MIERKDSMNDQANLWFLENVDLLDLMCPTKTPHLEEKHSPNIFKKDQFIYFPDEPSNHVFLIANGRVKIGSYSNNGKEVIKAILGEGELFGELALTGEGVRSDFALSLDNDTRICQMNIEDMQEMMKGSQPLSLKIFKLMGLRIKKIERRLESLVFKDARSRVVEFLYELAQERGQKVGFETMVKNHFTHKDIASLTGTSRQTVTTILNELKEKNLINFDRRRILIRDMDKLGAELV
ncbi:MAG: Crp/Fnr family transcriptional regulator [Bacteroidetes bacterium]|nr:Crp/Fnr family transcriptional regulator [Bacteroidota bacterium]MDA1120947.1 Crp/Fnr family transcriptional regulator [Bacteroidota bacterium]